MFYSLKTILIFSPCLLFSLNTPALEANKNNRLTCSEKHLDTNEEVEVKTVSGITRDKIATAQWPLGYPSIFINDRAFLKLPINARQFIYCHECAHLKFGIKNQLDADCKSLEIINEKHGLSEIDARKLLKTLLKEFGMSHRWRKLLQCEII